MRPKTFKNPKRGIIVQVPINLSFFRENNSIFLMLNLFLLQTFDPELPSCVCLFSVILQGFDIEGQNILKKSCLQVPM